MAFIRRAKRAIRQVFKESLDTPLHISCAVGFGVFMGIAPVWGFQTALALMLAHLFRLNKVLVVLASNISVPPAIPLIVFASLAMGNFLLGAETAAPLLPVQPTLEAAKMSMKAWVVGSLALASAAGLTAGVGLFAALSLRGLLAKNRGAPSSSAAQSVTNS